MVGAPALAPKQDLDPPVSVPDPCLRDLDDPLPQGPIVLAMRTIPLRGPVEANDPAGPPSISHLSQREGPYGARL